MSNRPVTSNPTSTQHHVSVIGAGVVGLCTALKLLNDGHGVTLFDPRVPGTATSFGNAGSISTTALMPYSIPGNVETLALDARQ
ncbi:MAG: hypothetical protein CMO26_14165 [Thiotrichales bacterium]|nr:hypothetical protein [Thiotrichales bacterium]